MSLSRSKRRPWVFLLGLLARTATAQLSVTDIVAQVNSEDLRWFHTNLYVWTGQNRGFTDTASALVPRVPANQHDAARDMVVACFSNWGWQVELDPFWFTRSYGSLYTYTNCHNVVAIKPGLDPTNHGIYIIGGHYDSVDPGQWLAWSPGADDNASGVAGVLEIARVLSAYTFRATLVCIAFDGEEKGLKGAYHFVSDSTTNNPAVTNKIQRSLVRGVISLDMITFNPAGTYSNTIRIYGYNTDTSRPIRTNLASALPRYGALQIYNSGSSSASDHYPFGINGMDSCLLIERAYSSNTNYHKVTDAADQPGYLDYDYAARVARGVAGYLCEQARVMPPARMDIAPQDATEDRFLIAWDGFPGLTYALDSIESLSGAGTWAELTVLTNGPAGSSLCVTDEVSGVDQKFYRVRSW
ncbi:MAG: Zn-dependent exopeptidase M28 [Verrucomicrobia bacterium]|nr:Zn-dependent exopeptidase M28 [Verrucomicrobiota bacterium]